IDFEELEGNSWNPPTMSVLGVDFDISITGWNDPGDAHDCGTGDVLVFDTDVASAVDNDLVVAGQSVVPNLGNVVAHQSCETPGTANDADVETFMQFAFTPGNYVVTSYTALDQEGPDGEFIALQIDIATDGTQVGITDITVDNGDAVEVVDVNPDAGFGQTLDFHFDGSGAIDDIEVCKIIERGGEGCTPGYWKQSQHFGNWPVDPFTFTFGDAFGGFCDSDSANLRRPEDTGTDICSITLLEALGLRGGGINALGRHASAAWLNAGSTVEFKYLQSEVETMVEAALASETYGPTKDALAEANEAGCPLARADL
ncbi:MAG: hypothetical protein ACE5FP_09885, partial [Gemmatimonadota bacterium]